MEEWTTHRQREMNEAEGVKRKKSITQSPFFFLRHFHCSSRGLSTEGKKATLTPPYRLLSLSLLLLPSINHSIDRSYMHCTKIPGWDFIRVCTQVSSAHGLSASASSYMYIYICIQKLFRSFPDRWVCFIKFSTNTNKWYTRRSSTKAKNKKWHEWEERCRLVAFVCWQAKQNECTLQHANHKRRNERQKENTKSYSLFYKRERERERM